MLSAESACEFEPRVVPEFEDRDEAELDDAGESGDTTVTEEQAVDWSESFEEGAFGICASSRRKHADDDDDSDLGFEDFGFDDAPGTDDDFEDDSDDDEDADDDFEDDLDEDDDEDDHQS